MGTDFIPTKKWAIIIPPDMSQVEKSAADLSRCIALLTQAVKGNPLAGEIEKKPEIFRAFDPMPNDDFSLIVLNCDNSCSSRNGFEWRAGSERVEIFGESLRGLCNGIYSFLAALGISWPLVGQEKLPSQGVSLKCNNVCEPSLFDGDNPAAAPFKRFMPSGLREIKTILSKSEAFVTWAARNCYDAIILPLAVFASKKSVNSLNSLRKCAGDYGIVLEAGGRDFSTFVPRKYFLFHRDYFRMEDGQRKKDYHFCATNPDAIRIIGKEGEKLFRAAREIKVFHLWPSETAWCSCPSCRAFSTEEQYHIGINAVADVLATVNPEAVVSFFKTGGNIPLRKNTYKVEKLEVKS